MNPSYEVTEAKAAEVGLTNEHVVGVVLVMPGGDRVMCPMADKDAILFADQLRQAVTRAAAIRGAAHQAMVS